MSKKVFLISFLLIDIILFSGAIYLALSPIMQEHLGRLTMRQQYPLASDLLRTYAETTDIDGWLVKIENNLIYVTDGQDRETSFSLDKDTKFRELIFVKKEISIQQDLELKKDEEISFADLRAGDRLSLLVVPSDPEGDDRVVMIIRKIILD